MPPETRGRRLARVLRDALTGAGRGAEAEVAAVAAETLGSVRQQAQQVGDMFGAPAWARLEGRTQPAPAVRLLDRLTTGVRGRETAARAAVPQTRAGRIGATVGGAFGGAAGETVVAAPNLVAPSPRAVARMRLGVPVHPLDGARVPALSTKPVGPDPWLSGSQFLDAAGRPTVLYHANAQGALEGGAFDLARAGTGFLRDARKNAPPAIYLTDMRRHAEVYGRPMEFHAAIRDPLRVRVEDLLEEWRRSEFADRYGSSQEMVDDYYDGDLYRALNADEEFASYLHQARAGGRDGVVVDFGRLKDGAFGPAGRVVMALSPGQLRPAPPTPIARGPR